jgi:peroxiredoxin Q/BCP
LPFTLLADPSQETIKAYDAKGLLFNKRITYIVNPKGIIAKAYPDVDPASHAKQILEDVLVLQ